MALDLAAIPNTHIQAGGGSVLSSGLPGPLGWQEEVSVCLYNVTRMLNPAEEIGAFVA